MSLTLKKNWGRSLFIAGLLGLMSFSVSAQEQQTEPLTLDQLLGLIKEGRVEISAQEQQRYQRFETQRNRRQQNLRQLERELNQAEDEVSRMEAEINRNKETIVQLRQAKDEAFGALKEAFGNLQAAAQEHSVNLASSLSTGEVGYERVEFLEALAVELENSDRLPDITKIERMWYELAREISIQGQIHRFTTQVRTEDGSIGDCEVVRIGSYGVVCDGAYAVLGSHGIYSQLPRQPAARFVSTAANIQDASAGELVAFGIDPTGPQGNSLLKNLIQTPTIEERVQQGGIVGNIIIGLGLFGTLLALLKLLGLTFTGIAVSRQAKSNDYSAKNPLGRVLKVYDDDKEADLDTLESKLAEAIAGERPSIQRFVNILKVIATVAPLLGLLGTVTGMIITFQAITLYGTGDPKTMAGGISTALVTTVLGLCVAVPMVLLHAIVQSRASSILEIIEQRSLGMVAKRAEELGRQLD